MPDELLLQIIKNIDELRLRIGNLENIDRFAASAGAWVDRPVNPIVGELYLATDSDRRILYTNDGTRWISQPIEKNLVLRNASNPATAPGAGNSLILAAGVSAVGDMLVSELILNANFLTAQSGANYYTISNSLGVGGANTQTYTSTGLRKIVLISNGTNVYAKTNTEFNITLTQTGAPGNVELYGTLLYRLVG